MANHFAHLVSDGEPECAQQLAMSRSIFCMSNKKPLSEANGVRTNKR
jgi:hypothetical protein